MFAFQSHIIPHFFRIDTCVVHTTSHPSTLVQVRSSGWTQVVGCSLCCRQYTIPLHNRSLGNETRNMAHWGHCVRCVSRTSRWRGAVFRCYFSDVLSRLPHVFVCLTGVSGLCEGVTDCVTYQGPSWDFFCGWCRPQPRIHKAYLIIISYTPLKWAFSPVRTSLESIKTQHKYSLFFYQNVIPGYQTMFCLLIQLFWCVANLVITWNIRWNQVSVTLKFKISQGYSRYTLFLLQVRLLYTKRGSDWPILKHENRKIMRSGLWDHFKIIVLIPNSILNTFLSGRVRYLFRKFNFC